MRQRSNLIILFGIAFFLIGGAIVYLVVTDDEDGGGATATGPGEVTVFVASSEIPANTTGADVIEQGLLSTDQVPAGSQPVGAITSAGGLDNQIFVVGVGEGEVITSSQLAVRSLSNVSVPEGYDGVAVTLPYTNGGAGYVAPGDTVNVYGQYGTSDEAAGLSNAGGPGAALPRTELILTNVLVLDVSAQDPRSTSAPADAQQAQQTTSVNRQTSGSPLTYLLALRPTDAERVMQVSQFAQLYFSLTADDAAPAGDTPGADGRTVLDPVSADSALPRG
ncbi:MAG: Flp pilus assembly protein CpaB [Acidimicrobiia bacterium]